MVVSEGDSGCANRVAMLNQLHHILRVADLCLLDADDLDLLSAVLQHTQLLLVVQQIKYLSQQVGRTCFIYSSLFTVKVATKKNIENIFTNETLTLN